MLGSSARLLRLLALLQARATWTGAELTSRLEVTDRTLRRDIDRLRSLGYPVHSTSGPAGGYMLGAGASLPPLMLDNDEGLAIAVALQGGVAGVSGVAEAGQRALAKLDQVLPARLRRRLDAVRAAIVRLPDAAPQVALGIVDALAAGCAEHRIVHFGYRDQAGRATRRVAEPHRLVLMGRLWYLVAWDQGRADWRTFRADRIAAPIALGESFAPRPAPDDDVAAFVTRAVSWTHYPHKASIRLRVPIAKARRHIPPAYGAVTAIDARTCRLETGASSLDGIARWLIISGLPFEIESPPALARRMRAITGRLLRTTLLKGRTRGRG
jgi:predicted DNA-binding transcriptional regulator YafY